MPGGRNIGVLGLDDSVALALGKHLLARYLHAGLAAARPTKGRRAGEAYYATNTHILSVWDGTAWIEGGVGPTGPAGATGPAGHIGIGLDGADGADGLPLPGPQGTVGATGAAGADSTRMGPPGLDGEDGLDGIPIPGSVGAAGAAGAEGATGAAGAAGVGIMGPPGMDGEDGQDTGLLGLPSSPLLHERYTDAEAIAAVEAHAVLALAGDVTIAAAKSLAVDHIIEKTGAHGVFIDSTPVHLHQTVVVGTEGVHGGYLQIGGRGPGEDYGGLLDLDLPDDHDTAFDAFTIGAYEDYLFVVGGTGNFELKLLANGTFQVATGPLNVDHINEYTPGGGGHGVDIDGVLCKDDAVETDAIRGLREPSGPTSLAMGAVADNEYLKRSGSSIIGAPAVGGPMGMPGLDGMDGEEGFPGPPGPAGTGGGGSGIALWDADADTGIQVEESADEDKIRFDTGGVERAVWDSTGFDIETHMAVGGAGTPSTAKILAVQEILTATGTKSGIFVDVGYAGTHGSDALYGLNVTSRYQGTSPGTSAATYGLLFSVSYESAQTISNAVGVQGYLNSTAAGSGTWTAAAGLYVSGAYDGSKPATAYGLRIGSGTAPAGVVTFYGVRVEDSAATNPYLLDVGPTTRYFRVIGGAAPAANQTNVYINEGGTLRQVQWKNPDATGHLVATDKVLVLV